MITLTRPDARIAWEGRNLITAIHTERLTKDYGHGRGIFDLDLEVKRGEAFGLIGPNGAGKSTTLRLLMDLVRPTRGSAAILGLDSQRDAVRIRQMTTYVPGELPDYPNHTGERILDLFAHLRGGVDPARISALARRFDLEVRARHRPATTAQGAWRVGNPVDRPPPAMQCDRELRGVAGGAATGRHRQHRVRGDESGAGVPE
jgi:hypothetical protein